MKSRNKFLIILFILALSVCLALAASASEYDFIPNYDSYIIQPYEYIYSYSSDNYNGYSCCLLNAASDNSTIWYAQPYSFILVVDTLLGTYHNATYQDFKSYCTEHCYDTGDMFLMYWSDGCCSDLNESFFNKIYYYSVAKTYDEGVTDGIKQAHDFTMNFLADNNILYEPWGSSGELSSLEGLLEDNILPALNNYYNNGYHTGYNTASDEVYPLAFADGVNASMTRMEDWLSGKNLLKQTTYKDGDLVSIKQVLNNNVVPALDERQALGYDLGNVDGQALGNTEMYNLFIQEINRIYGTEYDLSEGISEPDLTVLNALYNKAFEAGELYQLNKATDDGGISDFLADISGTVLSTFFYLATNISFMGTSALSLISLFVIAVIVIFILKFVLKT